MEEFFLYAEKVKSNKPTQDCLSKKEVKEVSQDPAAVRHLNFGRQVMAIAEESRSFVNIFLNPLYKKTEGFQYKSGVENQTARLHAIKQRAYAYDGKAKCDHAARAQMTRDRRREGRREPISNKSDEYKQIFANLFSEYMAKMPADIINKHWPTFILCGRPAGRNGCTSLNSGKVIVDAEAATADNPTGTFRAGASLEVMESEGRMSRAARQSGANVAAAITAARNRAVNRGEDPDEAEKDIRQNCRIKRCRIQMAIRLPLKRYRSL